MKQRKLLSSLLFSFLFFSSYNHLLCFCPQRISSLGHLKPIWFPRSRHKIIGVILLPHNRPYLQSFFFCKRIPSLLLLQTNETSKPYILDCDLMTLVYSLPLQEPSMAQFNSTLMPLKINRKRETDK